MSTEADLDRRFETVRFMGWFRWFLGVITAVAASLVIVSTTVIQNSRDGCVRSADRANATANNWSIAAAARRNDGDFKTAGEYTTNVLEVRKTIAMPNGWEGHLKDRGKSAADRRAGCDDAYPLLIPFVD